MKQKKVILELYMEIWYCYQDGKSMAYPLFTTTTYEDADNICKKRNYDVIQVIDLELQDFDDTPDHITWWKGLNEEEQYKLCCKHFAGIPVDSLMERSIKVMYHYENPLTTETTTNTVTGEIKLWVTGSGGRTGNLTANDVLIRTDDATIHLDKDSEFGKLAHAMIDRYNGHDKIKEENLMLLNAIHDAYDNLLMGNTEAAAKGLSKALSTIEPNKY